MKLSELKGIGPKTELLFEKLGIRTPGELLWYFPNSYLSFQAPRKIGELEEGEVQAVKCVLQKDAAVLSVNGRKLTSVTARDLSGSLRLSWFNAPFLRSRLKAGSVLVFLGRVSRYQTQLCMTQPKIYEAAEYEEKVGTFEPVYSQTKGLSNALIRKVVQQAWEMLSAGKLGADPRARELLEDFVPSELLSKHSLPAMAEAVRQIHFPASMESFQRARKRLSFNELLLFSLAVLYGQSPERTASEFVTRQQPEVDRLIRSLPFTLTKGQTAAVQEIRADMSSGQLMNRLLQGDVGSGKTIIAMLAMLETALSGYQAALMAPTEILAVQHYEKLCRLLEANDLPLGTVLLTGSMNAGERKERYRSLAEGEAMLAVGTHALFQEKVHFQRLGLVVTDEQHRFGVKQRRALSEKGGSPHTLVMSATPIPRTLAMLAYGDRKVSRVTELPANRLPIKNAVVSEADREKSYRFIYRQLQQGRQAYVICPMVEENDTLALQNVAEYVRKLRGIFPKTVRIEGLHGKLRPKEKEEIMSRFLRAEIDILVSTTVVEVGVDVPNATVMLVENAERFGLAQLHQLRGRVGRSDLQSYCIFVDTKNSEKSKKRLEILAHSNDGFHIAEEDLRLRGPGDIFGVRQSGELGFSMADVYEDRALMEEAAEDARGLLAADPELSESGHERLGQELLGYLSESDVL